MSSAAYTSAHVHRVKLGRTTEAKFTWTLTKPVPTPGRRTLPRRPDAHLPKYISRALRKLCIYAFCFSPPGLSSFSRARESSSPLVNSDRGPNFYGYTEKSL